MGTVTETRDETFAFYRCHVCGLPHEHVDGVKRQCSFGSDTDAAELSDAGPPGRRVLGERYRVERTVGEGAAGIVYECTDLRLDRLVAVKLGPPLEASVPQHQRFLREARTMAEVSDPGTIVVYDFGVLSDTGQAFIAMELLHGETLWERMTRPMPLSVVRDIVAEILLVLGAFHARGVVHRDIKPDNVFLSDANPGEITVKILDFGLARHADERDKVSAGNEVLGTPVYMAPEQVWGGGEIDRRTDLFAVGSVLFEMLTGQEPLEVRAAEPLLTFLRRAGTQPRRSLASLRPDLPEELAGVVATAMSLDPKDRFPDARVFLRAFIDALGGDESLTDSSSWRIS